MTTCRPSLSLLLATLLAFVTLSGAEAGAKLAPGKRAPIVVPAGPGMFDAETFPSAIEVLPPNTAAVATCNGYRPSDVAAYWSDTYDAIGPQTQRTDGWMWRAPGASQSSRVTYVSASGTFRNRTRSDVVVAIWCE